MKKPEDRSQRSEVGGKDSRHLPCVTRCGFTMIEIAISLAVIGFALVAIIGILPQGMTVQKENRQETIINQDANMFLEAIRNGGKGFDDLTNYVIAITNYHCLLTGGGASPVQGPVQVDGYTYNDSMINGVGSYYSVKLLADGMHDRDKFV